MCCELALQACMHCLKKPLTHCFLPRYDVIRQTRYDVIATQQTNPHAFDIRVLYHYYTNECRLYCRNSRILRPISIFFLFIHYESCYVSIDITASDFGTFRRHIFPSFVFRLLASRNIHNFSAICHLIGLKFYHGRSGIKFSDGLFRNRYFNLFAGIQWEVDTDTF